ncbi:MAG: DNA polymerase IV [Thaumarchaeota archaeon]|nr:DNA polymerase IV [Nitrososphaerota archaeon]
MSRAGEFNRLIFHVDMDSFYASCELSRKTDLKGKPFVVGADPHQGKGRGVVLACNYEAKKLGLRSGMPISRAWELCPNASYVRPDFDFYIQVSSRVMSYLRNFAEKTEQVSIDEAYLEVTNHIRAVSEEMGNGDQDKAIIALAASIKKSISENVGITCSIGVADSKIIAKIATDMKKPDGLTIVHPNESVEFLAPLSVSKIPGVGKVTQKTLLEKFKVEKISDLRKVPPDDLRDGFGKSSIWLLNVANGIDESDVVESWDPVSISSETTFEEDEAVYSRVHNLMNEVAKDVHARLISDRYLFRNVGIKIRFTGFETHTRSKSLNAYSDSLKAIIHECDKLLSEFHESEKKVRLIGVKVSSLKKREENQRTLADFNAS